MIGTLEIYHGYINDDSIGVSDNLVFREENMIVDGAKEHIVDMLTRIPPPSAVSAVAEVSSAYDVSNFTVQGLSISPNESAFRRFNSLAALSGYISDMSGTPGLGPNGRLGTEEIPYSKQGMVLYSSLDPGNGSYAYLPDISNYEFSAVNSGFSGSVYRNGVIKNETFSALSNMLTNPRFKHYSVDTSVSAIYANNYLKLYNVNGWDIRSCLRHRNELTEYSDVYRCASLARHSILNVASLSSLVVSGYAEGDDGVLYARSFGDLADTETSSVVSIDQRFTPTMKGVSPRQKEDVTLSMVAEITAKFSAVSGGAGAGVYVNLTNTTRRYKYNFSATPSYTRNSWGGSGVPLFVPLSAGTSATLSHFVNILNTDADDTYLLSFVFTAANSVSDVLGTYFWDSGFNVLDNWCYGNVCEYDTLQRVNGNDYTSPALYLQSYGRPESELTSTFADLPFSSITCLSQLFKMDPNKQYTPSIWGETLSGYGNPGALYASMSEPPGGPLLGVAVVKKATSDYYSDNGWNYLTKAQGGNPSQWCEHLPGSLETGGSMRCRTGDSGTQFTLGYLECGWVPACSAGCDRLVETCLGNNVVWHPLISRLARKNSSGYAREGITFQDVVRLDPKPSDLCVSVSASESVSGEFGMPLTKNGVFSGMALKNYVMPYFNPSKCGYPGPETSKATDFHFVLRSSDISRGGQPYFFNFETGGWDTDLSSVETSAVPDANKFYTSSISSTEEWAAFSSIEIDTHALSGEIPYRKTACQTSGWIPSGFSGTEPFEKGWYGFSMMLIAQNIDGIWPHRFTKGSDTNSHFKKLAISAQPKSTSVDVPECYNWDATGDGTTFANGWRTLSGTSKGFTDPVYPLSNVSVFPYVESYNATGLSELGFQSLNQMCYASGSVHSEKTEYQLFLGCSQQNQELSSGCPVRPEDRVGSQAIRAVCLVDSALAPTNVDVKGDIITSQAYLTIPKFDIVGYPHCQIYGKAVWSSGDYSGNYPGIAMKSPISENTWMLSSDISGQPRNAGVNQNQNGEIIPEPSGMFGSKNSLMVGTRKFLGYGHQPQVEMVQTFTLSDLPINPKDEKIAFGFKYQYYDDGFDGDPRTLWTATAKLDDGNVLFWRDSAPSSDSAAQSVGGAQATLEDQKEQSWTEVRWYKGMPINPFTSWMQKGDGPYKEEYKNIITRPISLSDSRLTPSTKIRFSVRLSSYKHEDVLALKDWKFYRWTAPPQGDLGVFPHPADTTVQPSTTESPGELGHFTNHIQVYSSLSAVTFERALADGGWPPSITINDPNGYGFRASGFRLNSSVNKYGVVNSDGIIYKVPEGTGPQPTLAGNLNLNGMSATVSAGFGGTSSMVYQLDISSNDYKFLNLYGGIGALGLWTVDTDATYKRFRTHGHSISAGMYDMTAYPLGSSLYNVTDVSRNPIFKLFSKKVFRTPLIEGADPDFVRIRWHVRLV